MWCVGCSCLWCGGSTIGTVVGPKIYLLICYVVVDSSNRRGYILHADDGFGEGVLGGG